MPDMTDLLAQRAELERQIAAAKPAAVAAVRQLMEDLGVTLADLGAVPAGPSRSSSKRKAKYRDAVGNTWAGVGQRPRWLQQAVMSGVPLESFRVKDG